MSPRGLRHPGRWIWLLLAIPALLGFWRLRLDLEVLNLLPDTLAPVRGLKAYQEHFTSARELLVVFKGHDPAALSEQVTSVATKLRSESNLVQRVTYQPPWQEHPGEFAEFLAYLWLNQEPSLFNNLSERLKAPERILSDVKEELTTSLSPDRIARGSYDPFGFSEVSDLFGSQASQQQGEQVFQNAEGTFRLMFVEAPRDLKSFQECETWIKSIRRIVHKMDPPVAGAAPTQVYFTGRPAFVAEIGRGMERDMRWSVIGTAIIIAALFWVAHRRFKPLLWLLFLLAVILVGAIGLGAFIFGTIYVISAGFAAILLGLAVDYALLHYQEAVTHPNLTVPQVRRVIAPGVTWAAITTIIAFLMLNLGGLPGLAQLGTMVALGVALAAVVIVFEFLPPLFPERGILAEASGSPEKDNMDLNSGLGTQAKAIAPRLSASTLIISIGIILALAIFSGLALRGGFPSLDSTADALRPARSEAYTALAEVQKQLAREDDPAWVIISAPDAAGLIRKAHAVNEKLVQAKADGVIQGFNLPIPLIPNPENQSKNIQLARLLASGTNELRRAAEVVGFSESSLALTERVLSIWRGLPEGSMFYPSNEVSSWVLNKLIARTSGGFLALGMVSPVPGQLRSLEKANGALPDGVWISGWQLLGTAVLEHVQARFIFVVVPIVLLVLVSLVLAFRRAAEVALGVASLIVGGVLLLAVMRMAGWSWNLMNLMAVPLILGTGVDYGIFVQLALRRHQGRLDVLWNGTSKALLLCAGTAIAGFGSLGFSSNSGMAGLGRICAAGVACNVVVAVFFLPFWWLSVTGGKSEIQGPSSLYNVSLWKAGMKIVSLLPISLIHSSARMAAAGYGLLSARRRQVVFENLLPVTGGDQREARRLTTKLFRNFGGKLADLLRYEAGLPITDQLGGAHGIEHLKPVREQGRGALLMCLHLGNWEFGAAWLEGRNIHLKVITQSEPGKEFTRLRESARHRRNITTVVIRHDPFAFLEVIRLLEQGELVALLVDRPPPPTGVEVHLFGKPFVASVSAAELARATGCALIPSYVVWENGRYEAYMLPEITYDRASLRQRENRTALTQKIMNQFEPIIRRYPDQWYHFVPMWKPR